jgi:hypothetical protein
MAIRGNSLTFIVIRVFRVIRNRSILFVAVRVFVVILNVFVAMHRQ